MRNLKKADAEGAAYTGRQMPKDAMGEGTRDSRGANTQRGNAVKYGLASNQPTTPGSWSQALTCSFLPETSSVAFPGFPDVPVKTSIKLEWQIWEHREWERQGLIAGFEIAKRHR